MKEDIVTTLRLWAKNANEQGVSEAAIGLQAAADEIERTRAERDEARWMYCEAVILHGTAHRFGADGTPEPITDPKELAQTLKWDGLEGKP